MAREIVWSPEALEDVDAIAAYIARDSAYYASAVVSKILFTAKTLDQFPYIGQIVSEIGNPSIRERFVYSYRLIYQIDKDKITIIAVVHGKRLLDPIILRVDNH